jgi:hypothetical protein
LRHLKIAAVRVTYKFSIRAAHHRKPQLLPIAALKAEYDRMLAAQRRGQQIH